MPSRILTLALCACTLSAADRKLLTLVMPDVKVLAGLNVRGAAASPLGRYVMTAMLERNRQFHDTATGYGIEARSFRELLFASNSAPRYDSGLVLARGVFHPETVIASATARGALTEPYRDTTLITDPKQNAALAFLGSGVLIVGDPASVKAALDRNASPWIMPAALAARIAQLSTTEDAWILSTVSASHLLPAAVTQARAARGVSTQSLLGNVERVSGGVKFGKVAQVTGVAQANSPDNAQLLGNTIKLMMNLMQAQAKQLAPDSAQSLVADATGNTLHVSFHITDPEFRKLYQLASGAKR